MTQHQSRYAGFLGAAAPSGVGLHPGGLVKVCPVPVNVPCPWSQPKVWCLFDRVRAGALTLSPSQNSLSYNYNSPVGEHPEPSREPLEERSMSRPGMG